MKNIINEKKGMCELAREYAEYAKSEAPQFTPSNTKANELIG